MATELPLARPMVLIGSDNANSAPLRGPAVTTSRAGAGRSTASYGAVGYPHAGTFPRAAASTSADGPPGAVRSGPRRGRRSSGAGFRIGFTVSLASDIRLRRKQIGLRLLPATGGIVAREVQQDLAPRLLGLLLLAVSLETRRPELQPPALALQIAPTVSDQTVELRAQRRRVRLRHELGPGLGERGPRVEQ